MGKHEEYDEGYEQGIHDGYEEAMKNLKDAYLKATTKELQEIYLKGYQTLAENIMSEEEVEEEMGNMRTY